MTGAGRMTSARRPSPVRRLLPWLAAERGRLVFAVLLGTLAIGSGVGLVATSAWLISRAAQQPPIFELGIAIVAVRAFGIGKGVFRYAERLVSHDAAFRSLSRLRLAVYDRLAAVAPAGLPAFRRGDLLERLVRDVDALQDLPLRVVVPYAAGTAVAVGSVLLAWLILPAAGVVLLVSLLAAATAVPWLTWRTAADAERATAPVHGQLTAEVMALLDGLGDVVSSGAAADRLSRINRWDERRADLTRRSAAASGFAQGLGVLLSGGAVIAMLMVAIPRVHDGSLAGVNLAVLTLLPLATYEAVVTLPVAALALARIHGSALRVVQVLDAVDPVAAPLAPATPPHGVPALVLRDVHAGWPGGPEVVRGWDLEVPAAGHIGVTGPSGSGKSTLLAVLAGFLPYQGTIRVGGVELRDLRGEDVRRIVGWCPQHPHVFDTSVVENVRLARPDATDEEIATALAAAGLGPWLSSLPDGVDTAVGEHGSRLSAGQRQRLGLARVLLAGHPVVLLDEPTEHLDEPTARAVASELLTVLAGRTVVWVAHRAHGIDQVDRVVSLTD